VKGFQSPSPGGLGGLLVAIRLFRLTQVIAPSASKLQLAAASSRRLGQLNVPAFPAGLGGGGIPRFQRFEVLSLGKHLGRGALQHEFARDPSTNSHSASHQVKSRSWLALTYRCSCLRGCVGAEAIASRQWPGLR